MYTYIITDKRETKKNYEFAVTLSFILTNFQTTFKLLYIYNYTYITYHMNIFIYTYHKDAPAGWRG